MGECEDCDGPVGGRTGSKEAEDGRFGETEDSNWPVLCWRATVEGGPEEKGADVAGMDEGGLARE